MSDNHVRVGIERIVERSAKKLSEESDGESLVGNW